MGNPVRHVDLKTAKASAVTIRRMIADHGKICRDCVQLPYKRARWCDTGYGLAAQLARTEDDIRRLAAPALGPPAALF